MGIISRLTSGRYSHRALQTSLLAARDASCAIMRIRRGKVQKKHGKQHIEFSLSFVGSGYCILDNKHILTAHHVLNRGQPRVPEDKYFVFTVPQNKEKAYHAPVTAYPLERQDLDLAVLEIGKSSNPEFVLRSGGISACDYDDGSRVLTYGFPAPVISKAQIDPEANFLSGDLFLKGHANEGIIAAQYAIKDTRFYEFNVGWHHGESGGPVLAVRDCAAMALMQHYRNIKSPHGIVAGPRRGISLQTVTHELEQLGATVSP